MRGTVATMMATKTIGLRGKWEIFIYLAEVHIYESPASTIIINIILILLAGY